MMIARLVVAAAGLRVASARGRVVAVVGVGFSGQREVVGAADHYRAPGAAFPLDAAAWRASPFFPEDPAHYLGHVFVPKTASDPRPTVFAVDAPRGAGGGAAAGARGLARDLRSSGVDGVVFVRRADHLRREISALAAELAAESESVDDPPRSAGQDDDNSRVPPPVRVALDGDRLDAATAAAVAFESTFSSAVADAFGEENVVRGAGERETFVVSRSYMFRRTHPYFESPKGGGHSSKDEPKRAETG